MLMWYRSTVNTWPAAAEHMARVEERCGKGKVVSRPWDIRLQCPLPYHEVYSSQPPFHTLLREVGSGKVEMAGL
jgi:hypothetical protein